MKTLNEKERVEFIEYIGSFYAVDGDNSIYAEHFFHNMLTLEIIEDELTPFIKFVNKFNQTDPYRIGLNRELFRDFLLLRTGLSTLDRVEYASILKGVKMLKKYEMLRTIKKYNL